MTTSNKPSLYQQLKESPLQTDIGEFSFSSEQLGNGGNSTVFLFERNGKKYAIKFLTVNGDERKLKRFIDEYFTFAQCPSNENILPQYHFDKIKINDDFYYIIISKKFDYSLKKFKEIFLDNIKDNQEKIENIELIFNLLYKGIRHLHHNSIIHRDLKPENIYINIKENKIEDLVIGDFGIAHFDPELYDRLSETRGGERLANYKFSAPEQSVPGGETTFASDIFALGQIIQWLITGDTHEGSRRMRALPDHPFFDAIIDKCLASRQEDRFQSIDEINEEIRNLDGDRERFLREQSFEKRVWDAIYDLDKIIRQTCTTIRRIETLENPKLIEEFLNNFNGINTRENFWCKNQDGGDNHAENWNKKDDLWIMGDLKDGFGVECKIDKIHVYRGDTPYKNFFIIQTAPIPKFEYLDINGNPIQRSEPEYYKDRAYFFEGKCIDPREADHGYYRDSTGVSIELTKENHYELERILIKYGFMVAPIETPINKIHPDTIASIFIKAVIENDGLTEELVDLFEEKTRDKYGWAIKGCL